MKRTRFIIHLPNNRNLLVTSNNGWYGLTDFIKYFDSTFEEEIQIGSVSWWQSLRFLFGVERKNEEVRNNT